MRIAYLDCFSGISGDMFLGALVDAGVPAKLLEDTVAALDIGAELKISRVVRAGISATKVDVYAHGEKDLPREVFLQQQPDSPDVHNHSHGHSHSPSPAHTHGRRLSEIRGIIQKAAISETAKATAIRIFEALGAVEAEIHNASIDKVDFHEVGAVDAMVDIVCAAVGAEALAIDKWLCSPLNVGGGTVKCAHGTLPVPAPATLKLLQDALVYSSGPQVELVTPTGAAIVKTLATGFGAFPAMKIEKAGYGAGSREFADHPNVLRLTVGEATVGETAVGEALAPGLAANISQWSDGRPRPSGAEHASEIWNRDQVAVLDANLDDLTPQVLAYAMERLLAEGALDVFSIPVQMKKGRTGSLLTVLTKPEDADRLTKVMFAETTTLGVRRRYDQRSVLPRRWESVETEWGPVRIKIANMNGTVSNYAPEYEDCRRIAAEHHVPLKNVMAEALRRYNMHAKKTTPTNAATI